MSIKSIPAIDQDERRIAAVKIPAYPNQIFEVTVDSRSLGPISQPRPALIAYRFRNADDAIVDCLHAPHHHSPVVGARYRYLLQAEIGQGISFSDIIAPAGAAALEVYVLTWQVKDRARIRASIQARGVAPTLELLEKFSSKDNLPVLNAIIAETLDLPWTEHSPRLFLSAFQKTWQLNEFNLCWKVSQRLFLSTSKKKAGKLHFDTCQKLDQLRELAPSIDTPFRISPPKLSNKRANSKKTLPVLRLIPTVDIASDNAHPYVIAPALNTPTVFVSPIQNISSADKVAAWTLSRLFDRPWWIQNGLSTRFLQRASHLLIQKYALALLADKFPPGSCRIIHAAAGGRGYELGTMGRVLAQAYEIPFIFEFDSNFFEANNAPPGTFPDARMDKALIISQHADFVIVHKPVDVHILKRQGIDEKKIRIFDPTNPASLQLDHIYEIVSSQRQLVRSTRLL